MGNRISKKISNNLLKIRKELGFTQKEMAQKLGVGERSIGNYETCDPETSDYIYNLPIDLAVQISKKWNYDLNWIYNNESKSRNNVSDEQYPLKENINFLLDIRKFITIQNNTIVFSIPNCFWEYLKAKNKIDNSLYTEHEKNLAIAELNASYNANHNDEINKQFYIPISKFNSYLLFDDTPCIYITDDENNSFPISETQKEECKEFIKSFPQ